MAEPEADDRHADAVPPARLDQLGATLRRAYDEAANEPLPDALAELLGKLR